MLKYIYSILLLFIGHFCLAQADRFAPTSIRVGAEAGKFLFSIFDPNRSYWEFTADVDFDKYFISADLGYSRFALTEEYFDYESEGRFFRIGPDVNFASNNKDQNVIFFGLRYATSSFIEKATYQSINFIDSENSWPVTTLTSENARNRAYWFELDAGIKARIWKQLFTGFTVRYKILPSVRDANNFRTYYIPGFGKNIDNDAWGINYYFYYKIPFRKKKQFYFYEEK